MSNRVFAAFGVGLNRNEMVKHCPTAKLLGTTELKNYRLMFRGGNANAVATIEKMKGGSVPALLWEISPQDEAVLDRWIGVPELYRKVTIKVLRDDTQVDALIYRLVSGKPKNKPSAFYYSSLLEGYRSAGFDVDILRSSVNESAKIAERNT